MRLIDSPFQEWAAARQYDLSPAVSPEETRIFADRQTQAAFDAWEAGAASIARMITEPTLETEALRKKLLALVEGA